MTTPVIIIINPPTKPKGAESTDNAAIAASLRDAADAIENNDEAD